MKGIIIACPNADNAGKLRSLISENGYPVTGVCASGSQAIRLSQQMDGGVIVCTHRLSDMMAADLASLLPVDYDILILLNRNQSVDRYSTNILTLPVSIKKTELFHSIDMLLQTSSYSSGPETVQEKPVRSDCEKQEIENAKQKLIDHYLMTEPEAHRFLQKRSMDSGSKLIDMARLILKEW